MITVTEIEKLAELARIKLGNEEKKGLTNEIDSILGYIDQIKKATIGGVNQSDSVGAVYNIMREDSSRQISQSDRKIILDEAPYKEGDFVAVKKILE